jgi:hypothetical protein
MCGSRTAPSFGKDAIVGAADVVRQSCSCEVDVIAARATPSRDRAHASCSWHSTRSCPAGQPAGIIDGMWFAWVMGRSARGWRATPVASGSSAGCRSTFSALTLIGLLMLAGCDERTPTSPSVPLNQPFTLAVGESATIAGAAARLEVLRVSGDSRCPVDAICIQGGDAVVHIAVHDRGVAEYELHTGDAARASVRHGVLRITLVDLQPYPFSSRTIGPGEYRATFTAS